MQYILDKLEFCISIIAIEIELYYILDKDFVFKVTRIKPLIYPNCRAGIISYETDKSC